MKNLKYLLLLMLTLLFIPLAVYAEESDSSKEENKEVEEVNIYFFRGDGCSYCAKAEDWFEEIEKEYGKKFNVVDYETWNSQENYELMNKVAESRGETVEGVPYIIIGNKSWNGFDDEYKDSMLSQIDSEYKKDIDSRYDIMKLVDVINKRTVDEKSGVDSNVVIIIVTVISVIGIGFLLYKARQTSC